MLLFLILSGMAQAAELKCLAPFDDSSFYQLLAEVKNEKIVGEVGFSYVTNDGLDLKAKLKLDKQKILPGKSIFFVGSNGNMSVKAGADYWAEEKNYQGAIQVSFAYDGTPPVDAVMNCELR